MTTENKLKDIVQTLASSIGPRPAFQPMSVMGPETPEQRIAALESDVARLYEGLLVAGREIDRLRSEVGHI